MTGLEIYDYTGDGYKKAMAYGAWRVAYLNYAPRFDKDYMEKIERHNKSDEVFVLLEGTATLLIGEEMEEVEMEKFKLYNVTHGTYHNIDVSKDAKVLVIENEDTCADNSDYIYFEPKIKA